ARRVVDAELPAASEGERALEQAGPRQLAQGSVELRGALAIALPGQAAAEPAGEAAVIDGAQHLDARVGLRRDAGSFQRGDRARRRTPSAPEEALRRFEAHAGLEPDVGGAEQAASA